MCENLKTNRLLFFCHRFIPNVQHALVVLLLILNFFNAVFKNKIGSFFGLDNQNLALILLGPIIIFMCYTMASLLYQVIKDFFIRKVREVYSEESKE